MDSIIGLVATSIANNPIDRHCSETIDEAKQKGTIVTRLRATPQEVDWNGQKVVIQDAWIEHKAQRVYTVVVPWLLHIPISRHIPGYYIGVKLSEGWDVFWTHPHAMLLQEGKAKSFMTVGNVVLSEDLEDYDGSPITILLTDRPKDRIGVTIVLEHE